MEIIDISAAIRSGMAVYPGDPPVLLERVRSLSSDGYNLSRLELGVHTGTHIDAPLHFVEGGRSAESIPVEVLVGPAQVLDLSAEQGPLDAGAFYGFDPAERLLLKTGGSPGLTAAAAQLLVEAGVRLVGIDDMSIGGHDAHVVLLEAGVVALEGLVMRGVDPGEYELICAPLLVAGSDGAPARVFLRKEAK